MGETILNVRLLSALRLTAAGAAAALLAGCSSDASRLASGPFGPADRTPVASIGSNIGSRALTPPETIAAGPGVAVAPGGGWAASQPRPGAAIQSVPLAPPVMQASLSPAAPAAIPSRAVAPALSAAANAPARTAVSAAAGSFGPWTTAGGAPVTVRQGESASILASRYGVPMQALIKANGLSSASQVVPGASLVIPVYNAAARNSGGSAPATVAAAAPSAAAPRPPVVSRTASSSSSSSASRSTAQASRTSRAATPPVAPARPAQKAVAAKSANKSESRTASKPARETRAAAKKEAPKPVQSAKAKESAPQQVAQKPASAPVSLRAQESAKPAPVAAAANERPEFRWPARGRIIQGFKSGGNDGISIAVPAGTAVKAAESGVVAYAGSELKGYGKLVLIRHPNGFVSAYAHNGELSVKRGDTVRRGQTIAKSGQTGNVSAPQLHFELRKGSTPVDPTQYLAGL